MTPTMKTFFTLMLALIFSGTIVAQMPGGRPMGGQSMNAGRFYGKVVDANNKPLEAASVQLSQQRMDTVTKQRKASVLAAIITDKKGEFSIDRLPVMGEFELLITAVGYTPVIETVSFGIQRGGDMKDIMNKIDKDLGNFKMVQDAQQLQGVVIEGNKPMLQMAIDRKVFNVDKSLTSIGGTAADVMKNVPSVNVDIDGNVTLRNAPPQIFVDGRPSTLTLDQIPAEEIESVEIITNPSAKFDASGGGSGILNIVLKKNRKAGYNGNLRANVDSRLSHGFGGNINIKQGKVNFFANGMYNRRKGESTQSTSRIDVIDGMKATLSQAGKPENTGNFAFGRAGLDYLVDNRNTISIAGSLVGGTFNNNSLLDITRDTTLGNGYFSNETGISNSNGTSKFQNTGGTMSYKHIFAKPGKEITADVNYNLSKNSSNFVVGTQYFNPDKSLKGPGGLQKSTSDGNTEYYTLQTDYANPINENMKLEMGLRGAIRNYNSTNLNYIFNKTSNDYVPIPAFNSEYKFQDEVYAGYVTFSQKIKNFTYQAGGRVESSKYTGELIGTTQVFENSFPFSFFPSLFLTQKINDNQDIQLNYSRKVNRPNFFQLIPYFDYSDSLNISRGNPALKPEFTNLVELSYQLNLKKGNNILTTAYYRNTTDLITRYQYRDKNPVPSKMDSIFISSYENASSSTAYGLEVTSTNKISRWWNLTTNVNVYNSTIDGGNIESNLNNQQVSWFGKINNTFTLPKSISIQLTGDYTSKTILPPGRGGGGGGRMYGGGNLSTANGYTEPVYGIDLAIKKDFLKDKSASISVSMNDILRTKVYRTHSRADFSNTVYSIQDNERRRDAQLLRLNLNWRFGKFDTSLFKRKNMKAEQEGMQSGMEGMQQ